MAPRPLLIYSEQIALTNSEVPVVVDHDSQEHALGDFAIVGHHLGSYIVPIHLNSLPNNDEPLICIKLSFFPKSSETAIGVMVSHEAGT
jgi:hypothetical protein